MHATPVPRWLPNAISVVRILLVPVWVLVAEAANRTGEAGGDAAAAQLGAAVVLVTIGASDLVDGWLARRFGLQSHAGAVLDAVADKLAQVVLFTYLALRTGPAFAALPIWFLGMLILRDALLLVGYAVVRSRCRRVVAEHGLHGKLASLVLFVLLVAFSAGAPVALLQALEWAAALLVVISTVLYVRRGKAQLRAVE